jgi:hypothetical protein
MKKIYLIMVFAAIASFARAQAPEQQPPQVSEQKQQDIEALKVAFISKELELTPTEAEKFWPVYNQYSKELKGLHIAASGNDDVLDRDEKVLNLRKHYKEQFTKLLGPQRMNRMFGAEGRFHQILIKAIKRQQRIRGGQGNRPLLRKN